MPRKFDSEYQIEVMSIIGYAIYQCQQVEATISECWLLFAKDITDTDGKVSFEVWDYEVVTSNNQKKTMGGLLHGIGPTRWFTEQTEQRLSRFVRDRNRLVHSAFREKQFKSVRRHRDIKRVHKLASRVIREGVYFQKIFDAILGMQYDMAYQKGYIEMSNKDRFQRILDEKGKKGEFKEMSKAMKKST